MKIEIWSDIMCPFCYIGKRHFELALKELDFADELEIEWKSFQLDPSIPKMENHVNAYQYLADAKGISVEESKAMHDNVVASAKSVGLTYNFDKAIVANSFDAHRLIQLAKTIGKGDEAEEALFHAYFTEGIDMADLDSLKSIGLKISLTESELYRVLHSDEYSSEVNQDIQEAQNLGLRGVPFFVIDRKFGISGAQPVEIFINTLKKAHAEQ
jgi:predicted DsbA family dithiol-disulfide isomerase